MSRTVTVVDYGVGNLRSVGRALEHCGAVPVFATTAEDVAAGEIVILPGVGAFASCVDALRARGMDAAIRQVVHAGRPVLGICVGMQMLHEESAEFGDTPGFAIIRGKVEAIPRTAADGTPHKIPHIGWSGLTPAGGDWSGTPLDGVKPGQSCYFVHSFAATPADEANRLADCTYNGRTICAAVRKDNVYGVQFHPEKSGAVGLRILANFVERA